MDREQRIAQNESIFRAANERIAAWEERSRSEAGELALSVRMRGSELHQEGQAQPL
jgi:hypothetical protein